MSVWRWRESGPAAARECARRGLIFSSPLPTHNYDLIDDPATDAILSWAKDGRR